MTYEPKGRAPLRQLRLLTFVAVVVIAGGCSVDRADLVPKSILPSALQVGRSVHVMDVTGGPREGEGTFGGNPTISNEEFKEALVVALKKSNLFGDVSTDHGELKLYATIRSQNVLYTGSTVQRTAEMLVTYRITDRGDNVVWTPSYESQFSSTAFVGETRAWDAREGSARENLSSLLRGIAKEWPRMATQPPSAIVAAQLDQQEKATVIAGGEAASKVAAAKAVTDDAAQSALEADASKKTFVVLTPNEADCAFGGSIALLSVSSGPGVTTQEFRSLFVSFGNNLSEIPPDAQPLFGQLSAISCGVPHSGQRNFRIDIAEGQPSAVKNGLIRSKDFGIMKILFVTSGRTTATAGLLVEEQQKAKLLQAIGPR